MSVAPLPALIRESGAIISDSIEVAADDPLARHKTLTKHLPRGARLPTPDFFVVDHLPVVDCPLAWPVIVKPSNQDASVGLDQGSVVTSQEELERRVAYLLDFGYPADRPLRPIRKPDRRPFDEVVHRGRW